MGRAAFDQESFGVRRLEHSEVSHVHNPMDEGFDNSRYWQPQLRQGDAERALLSQAHPLKQVFEPSVGTERIKSWFNLKVDQVKRAVLAGSLQPIESLGFLAQASVEEGQVVG